MQKGITPVIAIILLLLITVSIAGFAMIWFGRVTSTAGQNIEQQTKQLVQQGSIMFSIESVDKNHVYIRNMASSPLVLSSLSFYVNDQKITSTGPPSLAAGSVGDYIIDDAQLAMLSDPANLRVTGGMTRDERIICFYCNYYAGYWNFDETTGTTISDLSKNAISLDIRNLVTRVAGKYGNGVRMDGALSTTCLNQNAGVYQDVLPTAFRNLPQQSFSLSWWANNPAGSVTQVHLASVDVPLCGRCSIWNNFGGSWIRTVAGNNNDIGYVAPSAGIWHHYTLVFDKTTNQARVYIDGIIANTVGLTPGGDYGTVQWFAIGVYSPYCTDGSPNAIFDDVKIVTTARTMSTT